jgi:hypothetical protein
VGLFQRSKVWLDIMEWDYRTLRKREPPINVFGKAVRFMCQYPFGVMIQQDTCPLLPVFWLAND